jgi:hypothetical protein
VRDHHVGLVEIELEDGVDVFKIVAAHFVPALGNAVDVGVFDCPIKLDDEIVLGVFVVFVRVDHEESDLDDRRPGGRVYRSSWDARRFGIEKEDPHFSLSFSF